MNIISYDKIVPFLSNLSFVTLFFSMIAYWVQTSGRVISPQKSIQFNNVSGNDPAFSDVDLFSNSTSGFLNGSFGRFWIRIANLCLFVLLTLRWIESGHFPLSNLYESLLFLSWAFTLLQLILENSMENRLNWLGAITSPTALFTIAFANFSLPLEMQRSSALVPALQSNWLMMHVTVMILSYAALIFGSLLSIAFLILTLEMSSIQYESLSSENSTQNSIRFDPEDPSDPSGRMGRKTGLSSKASLAKKVDQLSSRILGIGFPLLTIGILSGAVWANEAWGSYWSWDPKETWALLTWLVFAIYLHTRITRNWQGKKPAMIASVGFFIVWICYLGVNLLGEGLHSYGWLQS